MYVRAYKLAPPVRPLARRFGSVFALGAAVWLPRRSWRLPRATPVGLALTVDFSRVAMPGTREIVRRIPADHEHAAERYAQFTLIVLGEAFIKVIDLLAGEEVTLDAQVFAGLGFAIACALWWTYFDDVAISRVRPERALGRSGAVWVYGHLPLTLALTAVGVGVRELALVRFAEPIPANHLWLLVGAVAGALLTVAALDTARRPACTAWTTAAGSSRVWPRAPDRVGASSAAPALLTAVSSRPSPWGRSRWRGGPRRAPTAGCAWWWGSASARPTTARPARTCATSATRSSARPAARSAWPREQGCPCVVHGCGHVGCCDDSKLTHATARRRTATRSSAPEPGEPGAWCYRTRSALSRADTAGYRRALASATTRAPSRVARRPLRGAVDQAPR